MCIGPDSLVLSQTQAAGRCERAAGLLSRTLHSDIAAAAIMLPIVSWKTTDKGGWQLTPFNGELQCKINPQTCLEKMFKYSQHSNEADLLRAFDSAFDGRNGHGLSVEILVDAPLRFTEADVLWTTKEADENCYNYTKSLTEHVKVSYGTCRFKGAAVQEAQFQVTIQQHPVEPIQWQKALFHTKEYIYRPLITGPLKHLATSMKAGLRHNGG